MINNFDRGVVVFLVNSYYGVGLGQIWVDDINCVGNEINFGLCVYKLWGVNDCDYIEDVFVMCLSMCVLYKNLKKIYENCKKCIFCFLIIYK